MRRDLHALLAFLLAAWIPLDSAVAGWWHHHHRGAVVILGGPLPPAPCGPGAPWGAFGNAVVIDDRPLFAPGFVVDRPVALPEMVIAETIVDERVVAVDWHVDECVCEVPGVVVTPVIDAGTTVVEGIDFETPLDMHHDEAAAAPSTPTGAELVAPPPEAPTPEEAPQPAPPAEPPATVARPEPPPAPPADEPTGVVEPTEVVEEEKPAEPVDDEPMADAFEAPEETVPDDEAPAEDPAPGRGAPRNLFDEAPEQPADTGDDTMTGDDPPPEAFERPAGDDGFEFPADPPMDDASGDVPTDDMPADGDGFEGPGDDEAPMEEDAPADEPVEEDSFEGAPAADPFDSGSIGTPGTPSRTWRDDTGRHSTEGRLVEIRARSVRILKATGRHTSVPLERLSVADREHVAGLRRALGGWRETAGLK